jgi:hypothetical protein
MFSYRICGQTFHSNIFIDELDAGGEQQPVFTFQLRTNTKHLPESYHWLNHWYSLDGSTWLSFARLDGKYLLRFPAYADFIVSADARHIQAYPRANCPPQTMRHLLLNQVIPVVLSHLGKLVLHASACGMPQGVIAFMGTTGMGKSTLAASFGLRGYPVLTDDCLLVEEQGQEIVTVPSYPGLRLWPETVTALFDREPVLQPLAHYTDKKRLLFEQNHADGPHSLRAIYVLTAPDDLQDAAGVTITALTASEALLETVKHSFQLDITDRKKLGQAFRQYEGLAKCVPFFRLSFPREHTLLPSVNRSVLGHLDSVQNGRFYSRAETSVARQALG